MRGGLLFLLLVLASAQLQAQTATLRQPSIYEGELAELTITYESRIPSIYAVDTTTLETDFELLNENSRVSRVQRDGESFHRMQWSATLLPRRTGMLEIPPLRFGSLYSNALTLKVEPVPPELQARQNVVVELHAEPRNPYPGQQVRLSTRLIHNLPSLSGALGEADIAGASIYRSLNDARYPLTRAGEEFQVLERNLLLNSRPGETLSIRPAPFSAVIDNPLATETSAATRHIFRRSDSLKLELRPLPESVDPAAWLPATQLQMTLQREDPATIPSSGDTIGVVLRLEAQGLPGDVLPANLLASSGENYSVYADTESRETRIEGAPGTEYLVGRLHQRYAIVLNNAGEITLPGLQLAWWDVGADRARMAQTGPIQLQVAKGTGAYSSTTGSDIAAAARARQNAGMVPLPLQQAAPLLLTLTVFVLLVFTWRSTSARRAELSEYFKRTSERRLCRRRVEQACRNNDAAAARRALIAWSRAYWDDEDIGNLRRLAIRTDTPEWRAELARLDAAVFAAGDTAWRGSELDRLLRRLYADASAKRGAGEQVLPGLYPDSAASRRVATSPRPV